MEHLYIIADTDSCDSLDLSVCKTCPLAKLKLRSDGKSYESCAAAVGFKKDKDGTYAKAAVTALLELIITEGDNQ
jgi:tRNA(His) 5'-end guanylyltransferase